MSLFEEISMSCAGAARVFFRIAAGCCAYVVYELLTNTSCREKNDCKNMALALTIATGTLMTAGVFTMFTLLARMHRDIDTNEPTTLISQPAVNRQILLSYDEETGETYPSL